MSAPRLVDYNLLRPFASDRQLEAIDALDQCGTIAKAAKAMGVDIRSFSSLLARVRKTAASKEFRSVEGWTRTIPEGMILKGVSEAVNQDGESKLTWLKSDREAESIVAAIREAADGFIGSIKPTKPIKRRAMHWDEDLLNCFVLTDYHLGMKAFHEETRGEDWDMRIAEQLMVDWFAKAIQQSPRARTAVFAQLGDFLHWDGLLPKTPANGHILDADSRFQLLIRVAIRVIRAVVKMLLESHEHVIILMCEGNHDEASSAWLREMLSAFYENEPRITVDLSGDSYYCVEHGETSLFFHHSHKRAIKRNLDATFAAKFYEAFGRTRHRFGHTGHLHHSLRIESELMVVEQHRTLSASDAHSSKSGYVSGRDAQCITYSKKFGDVGRVVISPDMARAA